MLKEFVIIFVGIINIVLLLNIKHDIKQIKKDIDYYYYKLVNKDK